MKIEIVPATPDHAHLLAPNLRQSDKNEVMASGGREPLEALLRSVELSHPECRWTALLDGRPEIMWGAAQINQDRVGCVWLLSSEEMYRIPGRFLYESVQYVEKMFQTFDTLFNYVHAMNIKSQQWLENLGFTAIDRENEYGVGKQPFILYVRSN